MVYFAAGAQGLTAVVGTFFVKEYLDVSAAFIAGLAFWAGLPWALKMPLGHLVDLIWRWKAWLIYLGYLHLFSYKISTKKLQWYLALAFLVLLISWFGVNYLPSAANSVHSYQQS